MARRRLILTYSDWNGKPATRRNAYPYRQGPPPQKGSAGPEVQGPVGSLKLICYFFFKNVNIGINNFI